MQRAPCPARCAPSPRERRQARGYSRVKPSLSRLLKHENPIPKATKFDVHQIFPHSVGCFLSYYVPIASIVMTQALHGILI